MLDTPNERYLHNTPTPRSGGIAILFGIVASWSWLASHYNIPPFLYWISIAGALVALVSVVDDIMSLSPLLRLGAHGVAALILIVGGLVLPWGITGIILTWFAAVWVMNLYNFMDGMDGLAGGMAAFGFGFLGLAAFMQGNDTYAFYAWSISCASLGFLALNFPPARIFMGDAGSITLGLFVAAFSLWGVQDQTFSFWFPVLVFSPFIFDATFTLLRRLVQKEKIWEAHRSHCYQQLVQIGWGHRKTLFTTYTLMILSGISALFLQYSSLSPTPYLLLIFLIYLLLVFKTHSHCIHSLE